jgi:GNAT superfamily N-acetyltransferase
MIDYRDATLADGPELDAMAIKVWRETFGHSAPPADIEAYLAHAYGPQGTLIRDLADPHIRYRLATDDGAIVGYAKMVDPWLPQEAIAPGGLQLSQLYVAATHHGRGVADILMRWAIGTAIAWHANALYLTVWEENARAKRFYDKRGFVHIGDYAFKTGSQVDRDLIMKLAL